MDTNSNTVGRYDLAIIRGATFRRTFRWLNDDLTPISLVGASVAVYIEPPTGATLVFDAASGNITLTAAEGKVVLLITDEQTGVFIFGLARYKMLVQHSNGEVTRLLEGNVTVD